MDLFPPLPKRIALSALFQDDQPYHLVNSAGSTAPPEECKNIFKRFYRGDQARSMNQRYGLGPAIARQIPAEQGEKIRAS